MLYETYKERLDLNPAVFQIHLSSSPHHQKFSRSESNIHPILDNIMADTKTNKVLVFGPTGGTGRATALEAARRGAQVWLAMRDTSKPILGVTKEKEAELGFNRVQADLFDPVSIKEAVKSSGAMAAFVYMNLENQDHMRSTFEALKEAGICYVVLQSSAGIKGNLQDIPESDFIPWKHAQAEIALEETGISHTVIRPGYFASNLFWLLDEIRSGEIDVFCPDAKFDYVVREDIGTVCGAVLAEPKFQEGKEGKAAKPIYIIGPQLLTQKDAFATLSRVLGREIKIKEIPDVEGFVQKIPWMPAPVARSIALNMEESKDSDKKYPMFEEAAHNMLKYAGREGTKFVDWLEKNKAAFA